MAALPTEEDNARKILEIFAHFDAEDRHELVATNFVAVGKRRRWEMEDLQKGMEFARKKKWVHYEDGRFRLTKKGLSEMKVKA